MINRLLDGLLPTRKQPVPAMETVADGRVLWDRTVAVLIDLVLCYVVFEIPLIYLLSELFRAEYAALGGSAPLLSVLLLVPIYLVYTFVLEWRYGRTPGKVNRRLLVVMADGSPCTLTASAIRNLLRYVDHLGIPPFVVGLFVARMGDGRRLGDRLAGTVVVRSRAPAEVEAVPGSAATAAADRAAAGGDETTETRGGSVAEPSGPSRR